MQNNIRVFETKYEDHVMVHIELLSDFETNIKNYSFEIYDNTDFKYCGTTYCDLKDANPIVSFGYNGGKYFCKFIIQYSIINGFNRQEEFSTAVYTFFYDEEEKNKGKKKNHKQIPIFDLFDEEVKNNIIENNEKYDYWKNEYQPLINNDNDIYEKYKCEYEKDGNIKNIVFPKNNNIRETNFTSYYSSNNPYNTRVSNNKDNVLQIV